MAETIETGCDGVEKWHWYNVMNDLRTQGGLDGVTIDPLSMNAHGCGGMWADNKFFITWVHNHFLLLSMQRFSQEIVDAFTAVVEYPPVCRYERGDGLVTVEWGKDDPKARLATLQSDSTIINLTTL